MFPKQLVEVLTAREIANQQQETYEAEKQAQDKRLELEASRGRADMQSELAKSTIGIDIAGNNATSVQKTADGEAYRLDKVGRASAVQTEAEGLAIAKGLLAQKEAIGEDQTAIVNVVKALAAGGQRFMPETLAITVGAENGGGGLSSLVPSIMRFLQGGSSSRASSGEPSQPATTQPNGPIPVTADNADAYPVKSLQVKFGSTE